MDLVNKTNYAAKLLATSIEEERMMASLVVKARFDIKNNALVPREKQNWPIGQPVKTELGEFDEDSPFRKQGVDLMLLGKAYPDDGKLKSKARFELRVGELCYAIDVFGDRRWVRTNQELVASEPEPFESIPLTWAHAYGGKSPVETGDLPYHANPDGRGFHFSEENAEEGPLPNLEDPENLIHHWQDQPQPVGVAPLSRESSLRVMNATEFDLEASPPKIKRIKPSHFNNANPALILAEPPEPGTVISVSGVRPGGGGLSFKLPGGNFHAYVQLAQRSYVFPLLLDSITLLTELQQVVLGFRCCFRYRLKPLEHRVAILRGGQAPAAVPEDYVINWDKFDYSEVEDA